MWLEILPHSVDRAGRRDLQICNPARVGDVTTGTIGMEGAGWVAVIIIGRFLRRLMGVLVVTKMLHCHRLFMRAIRRSCRPDHLVRHNKQ